MPKNTKSETIRLSRFFRKNLDVVRRKSQTPTDFEASPYFSNIHANATKKKKVKEKLAGPKFRGFSQDDQKSAEFRTTQMVQAVIKSEARIKDMEPFLGFFAEEIDSSNQLCDKSKNLIEEFGDKTQDLLGFSKQDQIKISSEIARISTACASIRTNIYRNIDRRILTNHIRENESDQKLNCSKDWWPVTTNHLVKSEDKTWRKNGFVDVVTKKSNDYKKSKCSQLDRENIILSQIQKLNEELREIRQIKYAASEEVKLQKSPFIQIKKELIMTPFVPPKSPHHLIEEDLYDDPWALLVATIFLNKTCAKTARPYIFWFLDENPDPITVVGKKVEELETYFGALGLQKTRSIQVWRMSHDFLYKEWKKVGELYGVGRYAEDAFRMFCLGDFSVEPKDRYLKIYRAWYKMQEKKARLKEMND